MPQSFPVSGQSKSISAPAIPRKIGNAFSELYHRTEKNNEKLGKVRNDANNTGQTNLPTHFVANAAQKLIDNPLKNRFSPENPLASLEFFQQSAVSEGNSANNPLDVLDLLRHDMEQSYQNAEYLLRTDSPYSLASLTPSGAQDSAAPIEPIGYAGQPDGANSQKFDQDSNITHTTAYERPAASPAKSPENDRKGSKSGSEAQKDSKVLEASGKVSEGNPKENTEKQSSAPKTEKPGSTVILAKKPKTQWEGAEGSKKAEAVSEPRSAGQVPLKDGEKNSEGEGIRVEVIDERRAAQEPVKTDVAKTEDAGKPGKEPGDTPGRQVLAKAQAGQARQNESTPGQTPASIKESADATLPDNAARLAANSNSDLRGESSLLRPALQAEALKETERENLAAKEAKAPLEKSEQTAQRAILQPASAQKVVTKGVLGASLRGGELGRVASLRKRQSQGMQHRAVESSPKGRVSDSRSGFSELRLSEGVPQSGTDAKSPAPSSGGGQTTVLRSFAQQMVQRLQEGPLAQNLRQLQFRLLEHNRGEIRLRLNPEHLGQLRIHMSVEGSQLSGRIMAESAEAVRILQDNLPQLQESLREGGFSGLNVSVGGGQENQQGSAPYGGSRATSGQRMAAEQSEEWEDLAPIWQLEQNQIDYSA